MRRDDLPVGYDGWQVVDSVSSGPIHSLGPVPVKAIYEENPSPIWDNDVNRFLSMIHSEVSSSFSKLYIISCYVIAL